MHKHIRSLPVLVAVAVVALVLGSFGTATAAGLTKGAVKKIATKVVNNKAGSLSVANANQATNAANAAALGGAPASAYAKRMFIRVAYSNPTPTKLAGSDGVVPDGEDGTGLPAVLFPQNMDNCAVVAIANLSTNARILRRSTNSSGTRVVFGIQDDTGAFQRSDFDVIAVC